DVDFFFQAEDGIRDFHVTGVQTCALPIFRDRKRAGWVHRRNGVEPAVRAAQRALLDVGGPGGSQVVRGLEPVAPCEPVQLVEFRSEERRVGEGGRWVVWAR